MLGKGRGKQTLRQDEDSLLSAGLNGLAELGNLSIADLKVIVVLDKPAKEVESERDGGTQPGDILLDLGA